MRRLSRAFWTALLVILGASIVSRLYEAVAERDWGHIAAFLVGASITLAVTRFADRRRRKRAEKLGEYVMTNAVTARLGAEAYVLMRELGMEGDESVGELIIRHRSSAALAATARAFNETR